MFQTASTCFTKCLNGWCACIYRCESYHCLALLLPVSSGIYCWLGLRSVSIEARSCLLIRLEPSIVNFNQQGSLVLKLAAIVSINGLSRNKNHCFDRKKTFMPVVSFITASWWYNNQTWTSGISFFSWDLTGIGSPNCEQWLRWYHPLSLSVLHSFPSKRILVGGDWNMDFIFPFSWE